MLIAVFFNGDAYVERRHLTLQECAAHAAMTRQKTEEIFELTQRVGKIKYLCIPEGKQ